MKLLETIYIKRDNGLLYPYQRPHEGHFRQTVSRYHCGFLHDKCFNVYFGWYISEQLDLGNLTNGLQGLLLKVSDMNYHLGMVSMRRIAKLSTSTQYALVVPKRISDGSKNLGYRKLLKTARNLQYSLGKNDENQTR